MPALTLPIFTDRLIVRALSSSDLVPFLKYRNDPEVAEYQDWALPFLPSDAHDRITEDGERTTLRIGGECQVAIALRSTNTLVGDIYVHIDIACHEATIGYTFAREYWGCGYATEAVGALIAALFEMGVEHINAGTDPANERSQRVLDRLGFVFIGLSDQPIEVRGELVTDALYRLSINPD